MSNSNDLLEALEAHNAHLEIEIAELKEKLETFQDKVNDFIRAHCQKHEYRYNRFGRDSCKFCGDS